MPEWSLEWWDVGSILTAMAVSACVVLWLWQTLAGISELEEAQPSHGSGQSGDVAPDVSNHLHVGVPEKTQARTSRSPVRLQSKPRKAARRSLSLPSGGLSYGDVRILYQDGHFVMVDTSGDKTGGHSPDPAGRLEDVCEENERVEPVPDKGRGVSSGGDDIEASDDIENKVRAEILSLLEGGITDDPDAATDASVGCGSRDGLSTSRFKTGLPMFMSLPRRKTRRGQRPLSADEAKLLKYYSKSQQCLVTPAELSESRTVDRKSSFIHREMGNIRKNVSFTEAQASSVLMSEMTTRGLGNSNLYRDVSGSREHAKMPKDSNEITSRLKGPGFLQKMLLRRKGADNEKSGSTLSTASKIKNEISASLISLTSVTSTDQRQHSFMKHENKDSTVSRKISFRSLFKRKSSVDESSLKIPATEESCSLSDLPPIENEHILTAVKDLEDNAYPHSNSDNDPLKTPASSNSSSQSYLSMSQSQDDKDATSDAFHYLPSSNCTPRISPLKKVTPSTGYPGQRLSGDSFSEYDLSSPELRHLDSTLTFASRSGSPSAESERDCTVLVGSPSGAGRSIMGLPRQTSSPDKCGMRQSRDVGADLSSAGLWSSSSRSSETLSRNSNDSGILNDGHDDSSAESVQMAVKLRQSKSPSPSQDRPKSDTTVRWADLLEQVMEQPQPAVLYRGNAGQLRGQARPQSDLGGLMMSEAWRAALSSAYSLGNLHNPADFASAASGCGQAKAPLRSCRESLLSLADLKRPARDDLLCVRLPSVRRLSTPQPITVRTEKPRIKPQGAGIITGVLHHAHSMPDNLDKLSRKNYFSLIGSDAHSASSQQSVGEDSSDESEYSIDYPGQGTLSARSSNVMLAALDQIIGNETIIFAEALWDHVTMDPDELGFRAGDLIRVTDTSDKHWWYGTMEDNEGWFPATFVRLRVNQDIMEEELADMLAQEEVSARRDHVGSVPTASSILGKLQARTNVVNEIIGAEREYVKHLKDVVEGYVRQARKRPEMFPAEKVAIIFSNIEEIYQFAADLLAQLEKCFNQDQPHMSQLGQCFLDKTERFEVYSDYCNNHSAASEELRELHRNKRYRHFFEACRLLQEMIEIPLEGFLLTPVQKICKYHLQLSELLKFTPHDHPDFCQVQRALESMKKIAMLVNERKRKMESIEKLAAWQLLVDEWQGADILENSSELIYSGELTKVNHAGWSQERYFFLFDHQLVYCKKDLLKKSSFCYKGRINMDKCHIINTPDGRDAQYNVTVRHGWKLHDSSNNKWYMLLAKTDLLKHRWLKAFQDERRRVQDDTDNNFNIPDHVKQAVISNFKQKINLSKPKGKRKFGHSHHSSSSSVETPGFMTRFTTWSYSRNTSWHQGAKLHKVKSASSRDKPKKINWFFLSRGKS